MPRTKIEKEALSPAAARVLRSLVRGPGSMTSHLRIVSALVKRGLVSVLDEGGPICGPMYGITEAGRQLLDQHVHDSEGPEWCSECRRQRAENPAALMSRFSVGGR